MHAKSRISSILNASCLDSAVTGFDVFHLSELDLPAELDFPLPTNLRLGHLAERVVAEAIKSSHNFKMIYENVQILDGKNTIGELDFIIEDLGTKQLLHLELAYKFYLYDPAISDDPINNWIGPNRNDSLKEKLAKLASKQFPLLHHENAQSALNKIETSQTNQVLCLLTSLFIPYGYEGDFSPDFSKAIKGYYLKMETFISLDHSDKLYHLPSKKEWGIAPDLSESWMGFCVVQELIAKAIEEKQAPLCWQKYKGQYSAFFITWW